MTPLAAMTALDVDAGRIEPALFPFTRELPAVLQAVDVLLQATYTLKNRTFVREEKNRATPYHSAAINLTVHIEDRDNADYTAFASAIFQGKSFSLTGLPPHIVQRFMADPQFQQSVASVMPAEPQPGMLEMNGGHFQVLYNWLNIDPALIGQFGVVGLRLNAAAQSSYLVNCTRQFELEAQASCEHSVEGLRGVIQQHDLEARFLANSIYTCFLLRVLFDYLRPTRVESGDATLPV